jgi:hypothetical protein
MFAHEIFVRFGLKPRKISTKFRCGFTYRPFNAQFQELKDLKAEGAGLFAEIDLYPFQKYFFAGIRWDLLNYNWLTKDALKTMGTDKSYVVFTGTNGYTLAGFDIPVHNRISLLLYGMLGVQYYRIADSEFFLDYIAGGNIPETHTRLVHQFNIAVKIRIR